MKKVYIKILSAVMSVLIAFSCVPITYAADAAKEGSGNTADEYKADKYKIDGAGEVVDAVAEALGPATTFYRYTCKDQTVAQTIYTVKTSPSNGGGMRGVNIGTTVGKRGKVSSLQALSNPEERLVAAVNGDFFSLSKGVPMGVYIDEGRYISSSDDRYAIGFTEDGSAFLGKADDRISLLHGETELEIMYINKYPTIYGAYLLTEEFGDTTDHSIASTEYIISLKEEIRLGMSVQGEITEVREGGTKGKIPDGCAVLVVPNEYSYRSLYNILALGDAIEIKAVANERFTAAQNAIGGGDIILLGGNITDTLTDEAMEKSRNPRTAMGITADGELVFTVVDGRQPSYSSGVSATDLARIMLSLGCVDAINLDGGGSSAMVLFENGKANLVNSPSDKAERSVPNALAVYENRAETAGKHYLSVLGTDMLLLCGSSYVLDITVKNASGENIKFAFDEKNTVVTLDEDMGSVEFSEGGIVFTAGNANRIGMLHIETLFGEEILKADLFVTVTNEIDRLETNQTVIFSNFEGESLLTVSAYRGDRGVYFGDLLAAWSDNDSIAASVDGNDVYVRANLSAEDEALGLLGALGNVILSLADEEITVFSCFDDELNIVLDEFLSDKISVKNDGYTVIYDENGGVTDEGAFVLSSAQKQASEDEPLVSDISEIATFNVEVNINGLASAGLSGRTVWMWVDGLEKGSAPYAVVKKSLPIGTANDEKLYYDAYYDFTDFNGRALLKLSLGDEKGLFEIKTLLGYTAFDEEQHVELGPVCISENYYTDLYDDTLNHWSREYVNALSYMGIVGGSEDLSGRPVYIPDGGLSREQFAKILVNYLKIDISEYETVELDFADNEDIASWAVPYIKAAVGAGLMRGRTTVYDTVVFAPRDGIKRQEAFFVLGGLAAEAQTAELAFTDSELIPEWAAENIQKAIGAGLISGYDDGSIRPEGGITRGEAAAIVVRLYNFSSKS